MLNIRNFILTGGIKITNPLEQVDAKDLQKICNNLERSPQTDCIGSIPKKLPSGSTTVKKEIPEIKTKNELAKKLFDLKDEHGNARLFDNDVSRILDSVKTPEQIQLTKKLFLSKEYLHGTWADSHSMAEIISSAKTPEQALFKFDLTRNLMLMKDKDGTRRFVSPDISSLVSQSDTLEKALLVEKIAQNPELQRHEVLFILLYADTPQKVQLAMKLAQLENKNGSGKLKYNKMESLISSADTPEKAQLIGQVAQHKYKNSDASINVNDILETVNSTLWGHA